MLCGRCIVFSCAPNMFQYLWTLSPQISYKELGLRDIWWNCYLYESITCKINTCKLKSLKGNLKPNGFSETLQVESMSSGLADTFFYL